MPYVETIDRNRAVISSLDSYIPQDSTVRIIDSFVDGLKIEDGGFKEASKEGRPMYDQRALLKLYIYGNCNGIRSSRKLAFHCHVNIEVKWLMKGLEPDFRTIARYLGDNTDKMKKVFHEFNKRIAGELKFGFTSIDGSKFHANNSKDNNFTMNKLDDRIKWLDEHASEYIRILKEMDRREAEEEAALGTLTREEVEKKLKEAQERLLRYEAYRQMMEESGEPQISLTDADARLMKNKNGFAVAYNPQTAVDSETHLIRDFKMTNSVTDHGQLSPTMEGIRGETQGEILEVVADKGYQSKEDMLKCLEEGIIPHVITGDGEDSHELEAEYVEAEADAAGTTPEELKKCIHAGIVPEVYKDVITDMEVKEVRRKVKTENGVEAGKSIYGTPEEMQERAKEGYFVRDPERNLVYCPAGEILRQKCIKKNGAIRYANKTACRHCPNRNKCYKGKNEWKEIDFTKDVLEKPCREWLKAEGKETAAARETTKGVYEKVKVVRFRLTPDRGKTEMRKCLSEHPFGTIKRAMGAGYFLRRGKEKVAGEFALSCLGYNIKRAVKLLGFEKMMEVMA